MSLATTTALAVALLSASGLADVTHDEVVHRTPVPSSEKRHGEVRIVHRGETVVVQTVLHSKVLRRVAGEIATKEARSWPDGTEGAGESAHYIEALRTVVDAIRASDRRAPDDDGDRFREMRIDFYVEHGRGTVVISGAEVMDEAGVLRLVGVRDPVEILGLSADYVGRNMRLIVEDSFGVSPAEAMRLLVPSN